MKKAVLDIGSNSFLCIAADSSSGKLEILFDEIEIVRLSEGMSETGTISKAALLRADQTIQKFSQKLKGHKVQKVIAIATAAARNAKNQNELKALFSKYQIPLQIVSGMEEAELTYAGLGALADIPNAAVIDIGGASSEISFLQEGELKKQSLNIGAVLGKEKFFKSDIPSAKEVEALQTFIRQNLKKYEWPSGCRWLAVAGTATSLAAILLQLKEFKAEKIHLSKLSLTDMQSLIQSLTIPLEERKKIVGLDPKRADVILAGAYILYTLMQVIGVQQIEVSVGGIRYGQLKKDF